VIARVFRMLLQPLILPVGLLQVGGPPAENEEEDLHGGPVQMSAAIRRRPSGVSWVSRIKIVATSASIVRSTHSSPSPPVGSNLTASRLAEHVALFLFAARASSRVAARSAS
jgi:hypothetical protein